MFRITALATIHETFDDIFSEPSQYLFAQPCTKERINKTSSSPPNSVALSFSEPSVRDMEWRTGLGSGADDSLRVRGPAAAITAASVILLTTF